MNHKGFILIKLGLVVIVLLLLSLFVNNVIFKDTGSQQLEIQESYPEAEFELPIPTQPIEIRKITLENGTRIIPWDNAIELVDACMVDTVSEHKNLNVELSINGYEHMTIEPEYGDILEAIARVGKKCGKIMWYSDIE